MKVVAYSTQYDPRLDVWRVMEFPVHREDSVLLADHYKTLVWLRIRWWHLLKKNKFPSKRRVLRMTLNYVRWLDSNSGVLWTVENNFVATTPRLTPTRRSNIYFMLLSTHQTHFCTWVSFVRIIWDMCFNQTGVISTLDGTSLKLVDKFPYLGSSISLTEKVIDTLLPKAWTAIDKLSIIWKSDLIDKIKRSFFQAAVVSILLYGCTTWTLTKRLEKTFDGNYTRMLRAILNKSWRQYPTRHQLYGHQPPITKTIQVRRTRNAGPCWRSKDELISDVLLWTPTYGRAKQEDQLEPTYSSYVRIRDVTLKTCQSDDWEGEVAREGQGYSCWRHNMMMMMIWDYLKWCYNMKTNEFYYHIGSYLKQYASNTFSIYNRAHNHNSVLIIGRRKM